MCFASSCEYNSILILHVLYDKNSVQLSYHFITLNNPVIFFQIQTAISSPLFILIDQIGLLLNCMPYCPPHSVAATASLFFYISYYTEKYRFLPSNSILYQLHHLFRKTAGVLFLYGHYLIRSIAF